MGRDSPGLEAPGTRGDQGGASPLDRLLFMNRELQKAKHREYASLKARLEAMGEVKKALLALKRRSRARGKERVFQGPASEKHEGSPLDEEQAREMVAYLRKEAAKLPHRHIPADSEIWAHVAYIVGAPKTRCMQEWYTERNPFYRGGEFTSGEDKAIVERRDKDWIALSKALMRSPEDVFVRYKQICAGAEHSAKWTSEDDEALKRAVAAEGGGNWIKVASRLKHKTARQCMYRYTRSLCPGLKRGKWTSAEDDALRRAVEIHKKGNWTKIRELVDGRSDLQCRERYLYALDPSINYGKWTAEEEQRLVLLVQKHPRGSWSKIAEEMGTRTDRQCRRHYQRKKRPPGD